MKKLWFLFIFIAVSCDKQKPSITDKKLGKDEIKLSNPWVDFQTQYKNRNKNAEGC